MRSTLRSRSSHELPHKGVSETTRPPSRLLRHRKSDCEDFRKPCGLPLLVSFTKARAATPQRAVPPTIHSPTSTSTDDDVPPTQRSIPRREHELMDWRHHAICRDRTLTVRPSGTLVGLLQIEQAKAVCRRCPVTQDCPSWGSRPARMPACGARCPRTSGAPSNGATPGPGPGWRVRRFRAVRSALRRPQVERQLTSTPAPPSALPHHRCRVRRRPGSARFAVQPVALGRVEIAGNPTPSSRTMTVSV